MAGLKNRRPRSWFDETAIAFGSLGLGDTATALTALERATDKGEIWPMFTPLTDRTFDAIRGSARFVQLLKRVGLSDYIATVR